MVKGLLPSKHRRLVLTLGVIAIGLGVAALFGPWWVDSQSQPGDWTITSLLGPFGQTQIAGAGTPLFTGSPSGSGVGTDFIAAAALAAAGLAAGGCMVASVVLADRMPRLRRLGVPLGLVAAFLVLVAALGIMLYLPATMNQHLGFNYYTGFWGATTYYNHRPPMGYYPDVYGAGWGWYALVVATILFLTTAMLLFRAQRPLAEQASPQPITQP